MKNVNRIKDLAILMAFASLIFWGCSKTIDPDGLGGDPLTVVIVPDGNNLTITITTSDTTGLGNHFLYVNDSLLEQASKLPLTLLLTEKSTPL